MPMYGECIALDVMQQYFMSMYGECIGSNLLSSLESIMSWVWLALVRAEKDTKWERKSAGILLRSLSDMANVFPVPVGPTHSTCVCVDVRVCVGSCA